jgi:uncharacterized protein
MSDPVTESKPFAVVTGASSGIGFELAKLFAEHGYDLLICAEDAELDTAAAELRAAGATVDALHTDLREYDEVEKLWAAVVGTGRPVEAIALNAGVGQGGAFVDTDLADEMSIVRLNVESTMHLAKLVLRDMVARDAGGKVLFTSSIASTMPGAYQAVYNASKSFVQSFTEALQQELVDTDITITSLMPGPTETEFFERAGMADNTKMGKSKKDDPADVARQGFEALMSGDSRVVAASAMTKLQEAGAKVLPDRAKAALHSAMAKPQDDK